MNLCNVRQSNFHRSIKRKRESVIIADLRLRGVYLNHFQLMFSFHIIPLANIRKTSGVLLEYKIEKIGRK